MTIQQMLLSGGSLPPAYVGVNYNARTTAGTTLSITTPSNTQIGDLLLFFGSSAGGGSHTWSSSNSVTEVQDSNALPNLYFGYRAAAAAGSAPFNFSTSTSSFSQIVVVAYRYASYKTYSYATSLNQQTTNLSLSPTQANSTLVGHAVADQSNVTWSVNNSASIIQSVNNSKPVIVTFKKDLVSTSQTFTVGTNFNTFQGVLVAIGPA